MKIIFWNGTELKGFEAPEKEKFMYIHDLVTNETTLDFTEYKKAYAEAKRNALPILNPEDISKLPMELQFGKIVPDRDYNWPGEWEVVQYTCNHTKGKKEIECPRSQIEFPDCCGKQESVIILSLPNQPVKSENSAHGFSEGSDEEYNIPHPHNRPETKVLGVFKSESKTKTAEEVATTIPCSCSDCGMKEGKAADMISEYSDQQLAVFKEKLKKKIRTVMGNYRDLRNVEEVIDQL